MPPLAVAKASPARAFYRNVAVQAVEGAPEFRWFDGGAVVTTRPTRVQVVESLNDHLRHAEMLAPSRLDADYMLYTTFEDLRGPNVWTGDRQAGLGPRDLPPGALAHGRGRARKTFDASYESRWTGITPGGVTAPAVRETSPGREITPVLNGYERRLAATRGLMDLAFDTFMGELSRDGSVVYKTAVSCRALNGDAGRGPYLAETAGAYAIDCPGARYNDAKTAKVYPSRF
jgi:hypothetical protein